MKSKKIRIMVLIVVLITGGILLVRYQIIRGIEKDLGKAFQGLSPQAKESRE